MALEKKVWPPLVYNMKFEIDTFPTNAKEFYRICIEKNGQQSQILTFFQTGLLNLTGTEDEKIA
jgi:hypothetical protein